MTSRNKRPGAARRARLGALAAAAAFCAAGPALAAPTASTQEGRITGLEAEGMREFLGIRYAAPPVGPLRWQPPQPVPASLFSKTAAAFGSHCAQPPSPYGVASASEDCLFLNVYAPAQRRPDSSGKLPVMVWIHGGALVVGESDLYNPAKLVTQGDVIVVTINYRLGYLGYFATSGLDAEGHAAGNYGLMDQQYALEWVQRNIAGFGGDPERVTVFGESAGGLSTLSNLASPAAHGLFQRAIVESGAYSLHIPTLAQEEASDVAVADALGCAPTDAACLRKVPVGAILAHSPAGRTTIVDGALLPASLDAALKTGRFNRVPVMNGSNHDEYRLFTPPYAAITAAQYPGVLDSVFGPTLGAAVLGRYPASSYSQPVLALAAALTDYTFACSGRLVDIYASRYVPTYAYEFNDRHAPEDFLPPTTYDYGAAHASEIQFLFDIPKLPGTPALTPAEQRLSASMVQYWTDFARGDPNLSAEPAWLPYARGFDDIQSLAPSAIGTETNFASVHHCAFWDPVIEPAR